MHHICVFGQFILPLLFNVDLTRGFARRVSCALWGMLPLLENLILSSHSRRFVLYLWNGVWIPALHRFNGISLCIPYSWPIQSNVYKLLTTSVDGFWCITQSEANGYYTTFLQFNANRKTHFCGKIKSAMYCFYLGLLYLMFHT